QDGPVEFEPFGLKRLQKSFPCAVRPAWVLHEAEHGRPAPAVRAKPVRCRSARLVSIAVNLTTPGPRRRTESAIQCKPRWFDEASSLPFRKQHVPAIGQAPLPREVDTPLSRERHTPFQRHYFFHIVGADVDRVPYSRTFKHADPDFAPLFAEFN